MMKDLALTSAEAKETMLCSNPGDAPKYPYGTALDLNDDTLKKLGISKLPEIGEEVAITAVAKVTRLSAYEEQDGPEQCLGLQITMMEVNIPSQVMTASGKLYRKDAD